MIDPVITKVAQLGNHFSTNIRFRGKDVPVVVGWIKQSGKIELVSVLRDVTGMGDWEDIRTSDEWKESVKKQILENEHRKHHNV